MEWTTVVARIWFCVTTWKLYVMVLLYSFVWGISLIFAILIDLFLYNRTIENNLLFLSREACRSCTFSTHHFFPAAASLGYQTLSRFSACRVLPRRVQFVPVLRQVRAWSTSKCPVFQHGFLHELVLTSTATQPPMIRGHATACLGERDRRCSSQSNHFGLGVWWWATNHDCVRYRKKKKL